MEHPQFYSPADQAQLGIVGFDANGDPVYGDDLPMGVALPSSAPPQGVTGYDDNGNPVFDSSQFSAAQTTNDPGTPSPSYEAAIQAAADQGVTAYGSQEDMKAAQGGFSPEKQAMLDQLNAEEAAGAMGGTPAAAGGGAIASEGGGAPQMMGSQEMMAPQQQQQPQFDQLGSFLGGMASAGPAPAYSGGLAQIANLFGGGSRAVRAEMAEKRAAMTAGKFGNTPIPYQKPDGSIGMGRMAPDGTFLPMDIPGGGAFIKPTQFLNTGQGYTPVQYGATGPAQGVQAVPIEVGPEQTVQHRTDVKQAEADVAWGAKRKEQQPVAYRGVTKSNQDTAFVTNQIDEALGMVSGWSVGPMSLLSALPATDAKSLQNRLTTIRGRVAISAMIDMKSQGGAMGALSEKELELLQGWMGVLDQASTPTELKAALMEMKQGMGESQMRMNSAYNDDYGSLREYKAGGGVKNTPQLTNEDTDKMSDDELLKWADGQ